MRKAIFSRKDYLWHSCAGLCYLSGGCKDRDTVVCFFSEGTQVTESHSIQKNLTVCEGQLRRDVYVETTDVSQKSGLSVWSEAPSVSELSNNTLGGRAVDLS